MPDEETMSLCWDSCPSHLRTILVGMMTSSDYTAVTLVCGDQVQFTDHSQGGAELQQPRHEEHPPEPTTS